MKKSSTLLFMMNINFVPSICIHRSTIFIFTEKKISTHFLTTTVTNLTFFLSPTVCVGVRERERERERERKRKRERERERENSILSQTCLPQNTDLSVLQTVCVHIFRFMIGLFSLFCLVLFCFLFVCCCIGFFVC